jgi:hypothetical protein
MHMVNRSTRPWKPRSAVAAVILVVSSAAVSSCAADEPGPPGGGGDRTSTRPSSERPPTTKVPRGKELVVAAVGDIASPSENGRQVKTASTVADIDPDLVLGLGDFQYQKGNLRSFNNSYDRSWGRFISRTYPINGTSHDLYGAGEYVEYWNGGSGGGHGVTPIRQEPGWSYSFDQGGWHFVALNTSCWQRDECDPDKWTQWLREDLERNRARCTLAFMHEPYWTSPTDEHKRDQSTRPWIEILHEHGVDVLLQAHNHFYERFAPQAPDDAQDPDGIQAFVVGTGGIGLYDFKGTASNSEARQDQSFGVLRLDLSPTSYRWRFVVSDGDEFSDEGKRDCR